MQSCCFTGHRPDKLPYLMDEGHAHTQTLRRTIGACLDQLIDRGIMTFYCGMAMGVDMLCAQVVLEKRASGLPLKLVCAVPHRGQAQRFPRRQRETYEAILAQADEVVVLAEHYLPGCMQHRNKYMVDHALAIYDGTAGGTRQTVHYAANKGRIILWYHPQQQQWWRLESVGR